MNLPGGGICLAKQKRNSLYNKTMSKVLEEKLEKMLPEGQKLWVLRHTAEHVLHTALQNLYPKLKKAMGPATPDGFYHDFDLNEKVIKSVSKIINKLELRGDKISKVHLYFVPFEFSKVNQAKLSKGLNKKILIYSVQDKEKYDPEGKSKKARPGIPGIWFE